MYKMFTNILNFRLCKWAEMNNKIDEVQAGFMSGFSCTDNMFTLHSLVQKYISKKGGRLYVLYVDFLKAFHSIRHLDLFNCLKIEGSSVNILRLLISMYSNMRSYVRVNTIRSESFVCDIGTRQGDVSGTITFSLYSNEWCTRAQGHFRNRHNFRHNM